MVGEGLGVAVDIEARTQVAKALRAGREAQAIAGSTRDDTMASAPGLAHE